MLAYDFLIVTLSGPDTWVRLAPQNHLEVFRLVLRIFGKSLRIGVSSLNVW